MGYAPEVCWSSLGSKLEKHPWKLPPRSLTASLPLESSRAPIGKDRESNHHFSGVNSLLNFVGVTFWSYKLPKFSIRKIIVSEPSTDPWLWVPLAVKNFPGWMIFLVEYFENLNWWSYHPIYTPENLRWWFPIGISFSRGLFSGAMLVSGSVPQKIHWKYGRRIVSLLLLELGVPKNPPLPPLPGSDPGSNTVNSWRNPKTYVSCMDTAYVRETHLQNSRFNKVLSETLHFRYLKCLVIFEPGFLCKKQWRKHELTEL